MSKPAQRRPPEALDLESQADDPTTSRARARVETPQWLTALMERARAQKQSITRTDARTDLAEHLLFAVGMRRKPAAGELARTLGISRRAAQDHVTAALTRQLKRKGETLELKRAVLVAKAEEAYRAAMDHHKPVTVGVGIGLSRVELWPEPNEAAALKAIENIAKLDGLLAEQKLDITVGGSVEVQVMAAMQRAYGLTVGTVVEENHAPALPEGASEGEKP